MVAVKRLAGLFVFFTMGVACVAHAETAYEIYAAKCAACHAADLAGGGAPPLKGVIFKEKWSATASALGKYIQEKMPPGAAEPLDAATAQGLADFILASNSAGSGSGPAPQPEPPKPVDDISRAAAAQLQAVANRLTPVTDAMLKAPPKGDWLLWRGDTGANGFSELKQIDSSNVANLRLVWSKTLGPGANGIGPLVHDGVIFLHGGGGISAIDAKGGDTLWRYEDNTQSRGSTQPRGVALYGNSVFASTVDNHTMALDAKTGKLLWRTEVKGAGGIATAAPLVVKGRVFQGAAFCGSKLSRCTMTALDAKTGKELWRFYTIPGQGEPGAESWSGIPFEDWSGAGVWTSPTYDFAADEILFGTGNSYAVGALLRNDPKKPPPALYTNSTLRLDAKTGKKLWHFQHVAGDVWDEDWAFERMIIEDPRTGRGPIMVTMGKLGILDALDPKSGRYLWSIDMGFQDIVTGIDKQTGYKTVDVEKIPSKGKSVASCPFAGGVRNWPTASYDASRSLLFVPFMDVCQEIKEDDSGQQGSNSFVVTPRPGSDHKFGGLAAIDLRTGKTVWTDRRRAPQASAALATAGGIVFEGHRDRWFRAFNSATGAVLWEVRLSDTPNSFPITFMADGKQYVAVVTGAGTFLDGLLSRLTPEIEPSIGRQTLWVFALDR